MTYKELEALRTRIWNARRNIVADCDQEYFRTQGWNEALEFVYAITAQPAVYEIGKPEIDEMLNRVLNG